MVTDKIQTKIDRIKHFFDEKVIEDGFNKISYEITRFEVEERERELLPNQVSITIETDVVNPKNSYLKEKYFIILSKTGQVSSLLSFRHSSKKLDTHLKNKINQKIK